MSYRKMVDYELNREEVNRLVHEAIGGYTIRDFSQKSGLGTTVLSLLVNDSYKGQPRPSTLIKVARASEGTVTAEALLAAGGFNPDNYLADGPQDSITDTIYCQNCMISINSRLNQFRELPDDGRTWERKSYGVKSLFDLSGTIKMPDDPRDENPPECGQYYFKFFFEESKNRQVLRHKLEYIYGILCVTEFGKMTSDEADSYIYSIVTNSKDLFDQTCEYEPINLDLSVQLILTDNAGLEFLDEKFIKTLKSSDKLAALYNIV